MIRCSSALRNKAAAAIFTFCTLFACLAVCADLAEASAKVKTASPTKYTGKSPEPWLPAWGALAKHEKQHTLWRNLTLKEVSA